MKAFHYSDVLRVTTGRLVSTRHMDGVYDILNYLCSDSLFTHQLPRAEKESEPWLREQLAPKLFKGHHEMDMLLTDLDGEMAKDEGTREARKVTIDNWILKVKATLDLPEFIEIKSMEEGKESHRHTYIDPIAEAQAMFGDDKVIAVSTESE